MPATRTPTVEPEDDRPPRGGRAMTERTRNAQAQARHREKRKQYIDNLENSITSLKSQLAALEATTTKTAETTDDDGETTVDARLQALTDENERLKLEITSLKDKLYSGNPGSGVSSALSSPGGLEDEHALPSLGSSTSPGAPSSSTSPLRLDIPRVANPYPGLQSDQLAMDSMPLNHQISPSGVSSSYAARRQDTVPQSAPHMATQRHSLPSLLPSLSPSMGWGSRGGSSTTLPSSSPSVTSSAHQSSAVGYTGGWDAGASGSSSSSSQWESGQAYGQMQQHGMAVGSQSGSTYYAPRSGSMEASQARSTPPGLSDSNASPVPGMYVPEKPRAGHPPPHREYMPYPDPQEYRRRDLHDAQQLHMDAELSDAFPTYTSTSAVPPMQIDPLAGSRSQGSSASAGWTAHGQRRGVMPDMGLVGTSILPGGGLGAVPLPPGSSSEMASPPLHPGQYDQRRWSHDQFPPTIQWSGSSNPTGVNFHSLGGHQQQQQHRPPLSSTSSYSVHPLSSVPPFVTGPSSNTFSRSRSGSRSISSASFSDSPGSIPVSPAPPAAPGKSTHSSKSFPAISNQAGSSVGGPVKPENNDDLPMGVPPGLGR